MADFQPSLSRAHHSGLPMRTLRGTAAGLFFAVITVILSATALRECGRSRSGGQQAVDSALPPQPLEACSELVRLEPRRFPRGTHMPPYREDAISGVFSPASFSPSRDLVRVDDGSAWWESDAGSAAQPEDDHLMHRSMESPFRRLSELVRKNGGRLEIRDAYRPDGIHVPKSLHREGRALDLTSTGISLEKLAMLCWIAGFDWVYYEAKPEHVHCSVSAPTGNASGTASSPAQPDLVNGVHLPPEDRQAEDSFVDYRVTSLSQVDHERNEPAPMERAETRPWVCVGKVT